MASKGNIRARKRVNAARRLALFERRRQKVEREMPLTPDLIYAGPATVVQRSIERMEFNHKQFERDLTHICSE